MPEIARVCIGYDPAERVSYHTLCNSIIERSSLPVMFIPVALNLLRRFYRRERGPAESTDFAISRFLTPYLMGYEGWALWCDCDQLFLDDIAKLWELRDDRYAVQVVKHDHRPTERTKFLGAIQAQYPMKNWSSVMLMNCERCQMLTPDYVAAASGLDLHRFKWLSSDRLIGELPLEWNWLSGWNSEAVPASNVHFTSGTPCFVEYRDYPLAGEWMNEFSSMVHPLDVSRLF